MSMRSRRLELREYCLAIYAGGAAATQLRTHVTAGGAAESVTWRSLGGWTAAAVAASLGMAH